jgi:CheY-like chemotaxis protein
MRERRATRRPQCVLIADDVDDARELWKLWLTIWGFMPVEARNGRDALTKAADLSPSVILMDLWMPVLDGTAAIQQLKQNPATAHIPVIALTAQPYASARARALEAGAEMVLVKPCDPHVLLEQLRRLLGVTHR